MQLHYRTIEDVKQIAERSLRTINRLGSANGIQRLLCHWEHVVHNGGDYIEGLWNLEPSRWAIYPVITLVLKLKNQPLYINEMHVIILHFQIMYTNYSKYYFPRVSKNTELHFVQWIYNTCVLLSLKFYRLYVYTEWTRRNATTTPMVERPLHAIGIARLPPKNGRDLRQNKVN